LNGTCYHSNVQPAELFVSIGHGPQSLEKLLDTIVNRAATHYANTWSHFEWQKTSDRSLSVSHNEV